jgi:hypothetical protein
MLSIRIVIFTIRPMSKATNLRLMPNGGPLNPTEADKFIAFQLKERAQGLLSKHSK